MGIPTDALEALPETVETTQTPKTKQTLRDYAGPRITEGNAQRLWFIGKFPGADAEACSIILDRKDQPGMIPTIKGTEKVLRKLDNLGAVGKYRNPETKQPIFSLTASGRAAAYSFGHRVEDSATLHKTSERRANHYQMIAHVAAQFASPKGFFRESLGIEPVGINGVISEHEMRAAYEPIKQKLKNRKAKGESGDFGMWRRGAIKHTLTLAKEGRLSLSDLTEAYPALLTLGEPEVEESRTKAVHQPDLAVILDSERKGTESQNLLVEVELNKKSWDAYSEILHTYAAELKHSFVYSKIVYFTIGSQVETLLRKVDKKENLGLFESGRLVVLPILHRDGAPVRFSKRITIKEN